MTNLNHNTGRLAVAFVLALSLTLNIHAQDQKSPPGT